MGTVDVRQLLAGPEMDAAVAERMGWKPMPGALRMYWDGGRTWYLSDTVDRRESRGICVHPGHFAPSRDDAAATLVEARLNALGYEVITRTAPDEGAHVWLDHGPTARKYEAHAETRRLAICRAALAALED